VLIRRIARPMLAAVFVAGGVDALRNPGPRVKAAAPLVAKGEQVLPDDITDNIPTDPDTLVKINAAVQISGGLLLASGKLPRLASLALAGSIVPTTLAGHAFWEESDPEAKAAHRTQFLKNVGLLGGLLIAAVDTEGKPSVAWRTRASAEHAQKALSAALPGSSSGHTGEALRGAAHTAAERGQELAHTVAESDTTKRLAAGGAALAATAAARAQDIAHQVAESDTTKKLTAQGQDLAHTAALRGSALASEWADGGSKRGRALAKQARKEVDSWAADASVRAGELATVARARAEDLAEEGTRRGRPLAKQARKRAEKAAEQARKQAGKRGSTAADRVAELAAQAQSRGADLAAQAQARGADLAAQAQARGGELASSYR
jgi:uncharacterized membrane protein YphA (DoxX/SURF4 family)